MVLLHKHMLLIARTDVCATKQCKSISWHGCHCCCWMLLGYVDITMCLSDIVKPVWWVRVVTPEIDTHTQPFNCPVSRTTCTRRRIHPLTSILVIKHPLSTSSIYTIHSVLLVQFTCLALFLQPLFQVLWFWNGNLYFVLHTFLHPVTIFLSHTHTRLTALCPGLPGWASTRNETPIWIYWSNRQWVVVASAGPYASVHLASDR